MEAEKIRVLLVEDNPDDARFIQELLSVSDGNDFEIKHADDLVKCFSYLADNKIDLVLLDLWLPGSQGIETLHKVRKKAPDKPVIVLTALDDPTMGMKALKGGAQSYLVKGEINSDLFIRTLRYAMDQHGLVEKLKSQARKCRKAEDSLIKARYQLEAKVRKRTDELVKSNVLLKKEIEERKKIEGELRYRLQFEDLITSISNHFISLSPEEIDSGINHALRKIGNFSNVDRSYIFLYSDDGKKRSNTHEWCGEGIGSQKNRLTDLDSDFLPYFNGKIRNFDIFYVPRVDDLPDEALAEKEEFQIESIKSLIVVPMIYQDEIKGFLGFDSIQVEKKWNEDTITLLKIVGEVLINALMRKKGEEELRESEEKYRDLFENANDLIQSVRTDGSFEYVNRAWKETLGYTDEEIADLNLFDIIHPDSIEHCKAVFKQVISGKNEKGISARFVSKDGRTIEVEGGANCRFEEGKPVRTRGVFRDVTRRMEMERKLRQSEEKYRRIFQLSPEAIVLFDKNGCFIGTNDRITDWLGYEADEVIGKNIMELPIWDKKTAGKVLNNFNMRMRGEQIPPYEIKFLAKDGSHRTGRIHATPFADENGKYIIDLVMVSDITEKVMLEKQLSQAMKMEAIGSLAGGIAHNFRNILMSIMANAEIAGKKLKPGNPILEYLYDINKAADKGSDLIRELLIFGRKQVVTPRVVDLNSIIKDIQRIIRPLITENISLKTILSPVISLMKADPAQVEQIVMNLVVNARDALVEGGDLVIQTGMLTVDDIFQRSHPFVKLGRYVTLSVRDTGVGLDDETLSHIFEPFFTTKDRERGIGLGLSTVYGMVKQAGSYIVVESKPGEGTIFNIYFPAIEEKSGISEKTPPDLNALSGASECIMVVEDDRMIGKLIKGMLNDAGYKVIFSTNAEQAKQQYESADEKPDLLIVDLLLPKTNGVDLTLKIRQMDPDIKTLVMSGYSRGVLEEHYEFDEGLDFIEKPFSQIDFLNKVREILDR
ncbi:MAG: PAS domain S-box protein [Candidatus Eremiobacteraeota bacterium]|nr:PAS domain S-box protein [Candidatus Eremiobacteraeota bacterium]